MEDQTFQIQTNLQSNDVHAQDQLFSPDEIRSPIATTPTHQPHQKSLKLIDLKSPSVCNLLIKRLKKISANQNLDEGYAKKIVRTFPRTFRVQYSILDENEQTVFIQPKSTIQNPQIQERAPSRDNFNEDQQQNLHYQTLVSALEKIFEEDRGRQSPEYIESHAVDDSCILFQIRNDENFQNSENTSYKHHTPQPSTVQMFDPQMCEMTVDNQRSLEKLILKLSNIENNDNRRDPVSPTVNDIVQQISADQSVILITSNSLQDQVPNNSEVINVTPSLLSVFDLTDQNHIEQLYQKLELMAQDSAQQQPKVMEQLYQTEEHQETAGQTRFYISQSPQQPSPCLKTPNISEADTNKMDFNILSDKLAQLQRTKSNNESIDLDENSEYDFGDLQEMSGSQPASENLGTPLLNISKATDLKSPETQLGLFQRLTEIKQQQIIDFPQQ